jgi:hypothetical protein
LLARDPTDKPPALKRFKKSFFFSMILELDWLPSQMAFFRSVGELICRADGTISPGDRRAVRSR